MLQQKELRAVLAQYGGIAVRYGQSDLYNIVLPDCDTDWYIGLHGGNYKNNNIDGRHIYVCGTIDDLHNAVHAIQRTNKKLANEVSLGRALRLCAHEYGFGVEMMSSSDYYVTTDNGRSYHFIIAPFDEKCTESERLELRCLTPTTCRVHSEDDIRFGLNCIAQFGKITG